MVGVTLLGPMRGEKMSVGVGWGKLFLVLEATPKLLSN